MPIILQFPQRNRNHFVRALSLSVSNCFVCLYFRIPIFHHHHESNQLNTYIYKHYKILLFWTQFHNRALRQNGAQLKDPHLIYISLYFCSTRWPILQYWTWVFWHSVQYQSSRNIFSIWKSAYISIYITGDCDHICVLYCSCSCQC